ncbi:MAG: hypothetical protein KIT10_14630 [Flavobacteriales bacterium]|nr:hypothetical protein [Flavobacteriales bacterium]
MSTQQIYEHMASEATQQTALAELSPNPDSAAQLQADVNSGSKVAIHRLYMWIYAYVSKVQQFLWEQFRRDTEALAKNGHYGTRRWFVSRAKRFQMGHVLILEEKDATYAVDDPSARIITHAAVVELANMVVVKVAKAAGSGLTQLTPEERTAVDDYFQELRPPVQVTVLTAAADRIRLTGQVVYDGQTALSAVKASVTFEVGQYLKTLDFGGAVRITDLKAAMLRGQGVVDVRLTNCEVRTTGPWINVPRVHYTYAGHAVLDAEFPISTFMQWQVGNV